MNFLAEVLTAHTENMININLPVLQENVDKLKKNCQQFLENEWIKFKPEKEIIFKEYLKNSGNLNENLNDLISQLNNQLNKGIAEQMEQLKEKIQELQKLKYSINIVYDLLKMQENFTNFDTNFKSNNFVDASTNLNNIREVLGSKSDIEFLDVYQKMKFTYSQNRINLFKKLNQIWLDCVKIINTPNANEFKLVIDINRKEELLETLKVFLFLGLETIIDELKQFGDHLLNKFLYPVIDFNCEISQTECETSTLTLKILNENKPNFVATIANLNIIFEFLNQYINFEIAEDTNVLKLLGSLISKEFCEKFTNDCLKTTIPNNFEAKEQYANVLNIINEFTSSLENYKFLIKETSSSNLILNPLLQFSNNIDNSIVENLCQKYVEDCKKIMKKDLHTMKEVKDDFNPDSIEHYQVSNNVLELIEYLQNIIIHIDHNYIQIIANKLFTTFQNIFFLYSTLTPQHHKKFLETIPQTVALFYNNCNFLANNLNKFKDLFQNNLNLKNVCFINEKNQLIKVADMIFNKHLQYQKNQILEIIKDSGLSANDCSKLKPDTEKSVRQCLRQLELLHAVWKKVLPIKVYNKCLGFLLNTMVNDLIERVLKFEDISTEMSSQLVEYFNLIKQRAPKIFTESEEVCLHVNLWMKFNELIFVLSSSLYDIYDRWADGKGLLAHKFKPDEVKCLIRALFQNTDRRAQVLSKIK